MLEVISASGSKRIIRQSIQMAAANGKQWVMLAAGSNKWKNYRHQADVCHAYQIVHQNGIPDDQIVVMMYDDIANNDQNPRPGEIINKPNGPNVYTGVPKDYTGKNVTSENFLAALRGDVKGVRRAGQKSNPKVIRSGRNDTIFIYLSDHGNKGLFSFHESTDISAWMKGHHLQLNPAKTELLVFPAHPTVQHDLNIHLDNTTITPSKTARNLGVIFDEQLSFNDHIAKTTRSCRYALFNIRKLHAHDLKKTIKKMARDNKFSKMVIYMESCNSASMLDQLPDDIHVYAVSASTAYESSHACYFDKGMNTYLADEFSTLWMNYIKANDLNKKTFRDQFSYLQENMKKSRSCSFGDNTIGKDPISVFLRNTPRAVQMSTKAQKLELTDLIHSHEVPFKILDHRISKESDPVKKKDLIRKQEALHQTKAEIERKVKSVRDRFFPGGVADLSGGDFSGTGSRSVMDLLAMKTVAEHFRTTCFDWHEEEFHIALSHMHEIAHLLEHGVKAESIMKAITEVSSEGASV